MAPKIAFLAILVTLPILGFVCRNPIQTPPTAQNQETVVPVGWKEYRNAQEGYSVQIPSDWRVAEYSDAPEIVGFIAPDNPATPGHEPISEISVVVRENPNRTEMRRFYMERKENIFAEASGVSEVNINGMKGYFLSNIAGEITVDLTVLSIGDRIVEFELTEDKYRDTYDALMRTFNIGGL